MFFTMNGEPFVPEAVNPVIAKIATATVLNKKTHCKMRYTLKTQALVKAKKNGDLEEMKSVTLKCIEKNKQIYDMDLSLTGVKIGEVDDSFFDDKDASFYDGILAVLIDLAAVNVLVEAELFPVLKAGVLKTTGVEIEKTKVFTNQTEVLSVQEQATDEAES